MKKVITIAGSDSGGGAGVQTDLKTFAAHGVYGTSAITAVTAQNTMGVISVENIISKMVKDQIKAVFDDIGVDSIKIGMLSDVDTIDVVYEILKEYDMKNIVLDPVMISTSGFDLIGNQAKKVLISKLLPLADIITPNLFEAESILKEIKGDVDLKIDSPEKMSEAGKMISKFSKKNVLIKGGHLEKKACDVLVMSDMSVYYFENDRIDTKNTHGTGCTLSSAIASNLALGYSIEDSVEKSKEFISKAIQRSLDIGKGCGPTNPLGEMYEKLGMEVK
ncbi:bifunctional hydroxymethylpyrimidine kinase/phosphomethylpyrimidine kinase [Peptostreptococcus faecalis]|uniref:bifunctional hydroxymethylpyrimidine kinase/phosphomethylpyrimidine kinase n=1 Tax=Peptostreptococcus faecalis TaxID=2045015 RepID=UPI000C7C22E1|nr:bifunctional hydroxymethylpyrimidine kinase/phosphomethylpyrimidine kinase [Peptostreptococcus faecalis]